jgi:DNA repair protein RadC
MSKQKLYDMPREKMAAKGVRALSDVELLQAIIGSGNAQASVVRISKRILKQLKEYGPDVTPKQLAEVSGLGPARVSLLLASFELSRRYLLEQEQPIIDTHDKILEMISSDHGKKPSLISFTLDGAFRLINKRLYTIAEGTTHHNYLRKLTVNAAKDNAAHMIIVHTIEQSTLHPAVFDLALVRGLKQISQVFGVTLREYMVISEADERSLLAE